MTPAYCLLLALEALKWPSGNINLQRSVSIFRHCCLCLLWSCIWRDFSIDTMPQPPQFIIHFRSGSCFEHSRAQLNMDQSDSINNRTVKFVVSCCVVSKPVEVTTILASVESIGSWLHAGTCPVFVRWVVLKILHDIVRTPQFYCT